MLTRPPCTLVRHLPLRGFSRSTLRIEFVFVVLPSLLLDQPTLTFFPPTQKHTDGLFDSISPAKTHALIARAGLEAPPQSILGFLTPTQLLILSYYHTFLQTVETTDL
jgi:hypothetical protein